MWRSDSRNSLRCNECASSAVDRVYLSVVWESVVLGSEAVDIRDYM